MSGKHMGLHMVTFGLLILGGFDAGLAIFDLDIAHWSIMSRTMVEVAYGIVALAAIYELATHAKRCKECKGEM